MWRKLLVVGAASILMSAVTLGVRPHAQQAAPAQPETPATTTTDAAADTDGDSDDDDDDAFDDPPPKWIGHHKLPFGPFLALGALEHLFFGDRLIELWMRLIA